MHRGRVHTAPTLLRGHNGRMTFVSFISDDQIISASEDNTIRRWNLSDGHNNVVKELVVPCAVATSPNGRLVAMGGSDGRVRLFNLETPTEVMKSVARHADVIKSLSFSPDSSWLASGAQDGTMLVWSSTTLEQVAGPFKGHTDSVWWVCYSPDGRKVASCDREAIQVWDSTTWTRMAIYEQAWSLAWSSDGCTLFAGCMNGTIRIYNPSTGMLQATRSGHSDVVFAIALSHDAKFIATASWDKTVRLWEAATFQQIGPSLPHDTKIHSISISPDDSHLVSGARDSNIRVWNLRVIAPNLFKDFPLEPNRGPTNDPPRLLFPSWCMRNRDAGSSNASDHDDLHTPNPRNETPESSDHSSTKSKSSQKKGILGLLLPKLGRGDLHDGPRACSPSVQGSTDTRSSNSSFHLSAGDSPIALSPGGRSPIPSPLQDLPVDHSPSPTRLGGQVSESENPHVIREIRANPAYNLTGCIVQEGNHPVSGGSHGDIYRGTLRLNGKAMPVAIKVIKKYTAQGDDLSKQRRLRREIELWLKLDHKNVIPLLGTTQDYGDFPAMVCPWVENGSLTSYLERRNNYLTAQQRFGIINDVALGLQYLHSHSQPVVHGDISGSNILIHGSGRACIADFGLSIVVTEIEGSSMALTYRAKGTLRWAAPELFQIREPVNEDEDVHKIFPTPESDTYSFAGIMLQVLSGKMPYHYFPRDEQVLLAMSKGERPKRPSSTSVITDDQWCFMMECWSLVAANRPSDSDTVKFVHEQLLNAVAGSFKSTLKIRTDMARDCYDEEC